MSGVGRVLQYLARGWYATPCFFFAECTLYDVILFQQPALKFCAIVDITSSHMLLRCCCLLRIISVLAVICAMRKFNFWIQVCQKTNRRKSSSCSLFWPLESKYCLLVLSASTFVESVLITTWLELPQTNKLLLTNGLTGRPHN